MPQPATQTKPPIGLCMGSQSDWQVMRHTAESLDSFGVAYETHIISAHRTPDRLSAYAKQAQQNGIAIIIAAAGGAAHLPGMLAAYTHLPVLGVPVASTSLDGVDSFLSISQMPAGVPVATLAIGKAGAINAALLAVAILALHDSVLDKKLADWRTAQTAGVAETPKT